MKQLYGILIISFLFLESSLMAYKPLPPAPNKIEKFHEIATQYNSALTQLYNALSSEERVFVYYLFRASLPGNRIIADQMNRHALAILEISETLVLHQDTLHALNWMSESEHEQFFKDLTTYLVLLWANHSPYFAKEHANEKRTPARMNLTTLTQENFNKALVLLKQDKLAQLLQKMAPSLFDQTYQPTCCVANSIENSGVNFYSTDFTEQDYQSLSSEEKTYLNAYYSVEQNNGKRKTIIQRYRIGDKYSQELTVAAHWLEKAKEHARMHPAYFDQATVESLEYLIKFLHSGDEEDFRAHSIAWLKTNNRLDYLFGFIENYQDPKEYRGTFEAEVTVKAVDMQALNSILPSLEEQLPFPENFKREGLREGHASLPNASINSMIFGAGQAGPLQVTAAYCLPNYEDIRSTHGSKQIIYQAEKGLGSLLNPSLYRKLFYLKEHADFLEKNDSDGALGRDIWNVHCILHETLGHGSGKLAIHTFVEGDPLTIDNTTYNIGDTLALTPANSIPFFEGVGQSLEELRAEIIALYTSIFMFDELAHAGLYKQWPEKIGKEICIAWLIYDMMGTGLRRLQSQPINSVEISGSHAQANTIIMNYILDSGAVLLVEEKLKIENDDHSVLGFKIIDLQKACDAITELAIKVQEIKSTANGVVFRKLLERFGRFVRNQEHTKILQNNMKLVVGDLKAAAFIYPRLTPITTTDGTIIDIQAEWPSSFIEQAFEYRKLMLSFE
ncbi:MAG: dipeptidyl peptidase 3 [Candidatus Dependentiae bacterium]|nr:dipeptidyl peptidase 3 [Candidatus Dependentiae bacterium]